MATAAFDWAKYLDLATALSQSHDEASQRTSISRAYYSVYHAASAHPISSGYNRGRNPHAGLWTLFASYSDKNAKRLSILGNKMKHLRVGADYHSVIPNIPDQVVQQLADADEILALLAKMT